MTAVETFWALPELVSLARSRPARNGRRFFWASIRPEAGGSHDGVGQTAEAACAEALEKLEKAK